MTTAAATVVSTFVTPVTNCFATPMTAVPSMVLDTCAPMTPSINAPVVVSASTATTASESDSVGDSTAPAIKRSFYEDMAIEDIITTMKHSGISVGPEIRSQIEGQSYKVAMEILFDRIGFTPDISRVAHTWDVLQWNRRNVPAEHCFAYSLFWYALCAMFPDKHVETKPILFTIGGAVFKEHFQIFMKAEQVGGLGQLIRMRGLKEEYQMAGGRGTSTRLSNYIREFFDRALEKQNRLEIIRTIQQPGYTPPIAAAIGSICETEQSVAKAVMTATTTGSEITLTATPGTDITPFSVTRTADGGSEVGIDICRSVCSHGPVSVVERLSQSPVLLSGSVATTGPSMGQRVQFSLGNDTVQHNQMPLVRLKTHDDAPIGVPPSVKRIPITAEPTLYNHLEAVA